MTSKDHEKLLSKAQIITLLLSVLWVPIVPALIFGATTFPEPNFDIGRFVAHSFVGYMYSIAFVAMTALPCFAALLLIGWVRWWFVLLLGVVLGGSIALLVFPSNPPRFDAVAGFAFMGLLCSACFWLAWSRVK